MSNREWRIYGYEILAKYSNSKLIPGKPMEMNHLHLEKGPSILSLQTKKQPKEASG